MSQIQFEDLYLVTDRPTGTAVYEGWAEDHAEALQNHLQESSHTQPYQECQYEACAEFTIRNQRTGAEKHYQRNRNE